jgi:hypothetical protein
LKLPAADPGKLTPWRFVGLLAIPFWGVTRQQMEACHILFQQEGAKSYIHNLLRLGSGGKTGQDN